MLTKEEVEHVARLARLRLSDLEKEQYSQQLSSILAYVEKLQEIDTTNVEPTSQVTGLINVMREDQIEDSDISKELIDVAPNKENGYIEIPKVFNDK